MKTSTAAERYQRTLESYRRHLSPQGSISLRNHCHNEHTNYRGMTKWMRSNNISVKNIKAEIINSTYLNSQNQPFHNFIQVKPPQVPLSKSSPSSLSSSSSSTQLKGIVFTFNDGTSLQVEAGDSDSIVSLAVKYSKALNVCLD